MFSNGQNVQASDLNNFSVETVTTSGAVSVGTTLGVTGLTSPTGGLGILTYRETKTAPTIAAGALTLNLALGTHFTVALNANITSITISNPQTTGYAAAFTLALTADGTPRTITWPASVLWPSAVAPVMTSTNGKVDIFSFLSYNAGTTWYGFISGQNF